MARAVYPSALPGEGALTESRLAAAWNGCRPRAIDFRQVVGAIFSLLRTDCQWRLLPNDFPPWGTVWWYSGAGAERGSGRGSIGPAMPRPAKILVESLVSAW